MKKILLTLLLLLSFTLSACSTMNDESDSSNSDDSQKLDIFYTNDVHGAMVRDGDTIGLDHMANLMTAAKEDNPDETLLLDGGDALQGSAISNYYEGESYIEAMNAMGYDAMVVGNHEFDWGLETVTDYFADDGIAEFPLLGANVIDDETGEIPENIDPYTTFERSGRTIGVIGTIGHGLESSIAPSMVEGYTFEDPAPIVEEHAETLRQEEDADIVLLLSHDIGDVNEEVLDFEGDAKIDGIFNAHRHDLYAYVEDNVPIMQSGGYGSHVGQMSFSWDEYGLSGVNAENHTEYETDELSEPFPAVKEVVDSYKDETDAIFNETIIENPESLGRNELSGWIADLIRHATDADIGFQNSGGTRSDLSDGPITLGDLYDIWPFENQIKTVELEGSTINGLIDGGLVHASSVDTFEDDETYKVATNDYVFDQEDGPYLEGENIVETDYYIRDLAEEELTLQSEEYDDFDTDNPFLMDQD
ncbi:MAG: bifunctional metallophosphatase/5'-nucleotidase [Bacillota bacterium]